MTGRASKAPQLGWWLSRANERLTALPWTERISLVGSLFGLGALSLLLLYADGCETSFVELRHRFRYVVLDNEYDHRLALVGLDERAQSEVAPGDSLFLPYIGRLIDAIADAGPGVIALDIAIEPSTTRMPGYPGFEAAVRRAAGRGIPVVLPTLLAERGPPGISVQAPRPLRDATFGGYVNHIAAPVLPGALAAPPPFPQLRYAEQLRGDAYALAFSTATVAAFLAGRTPTPTSEPASVVTTDSLEKLSAILSFGTRPSVRTLATSRPIPIDHPDPFGDGLTYVGAPVLLEGVSSPRLLRDRVVLVAAVYAEPSGYDTARTPRGEVRGGFVHLAAIDGLLRNVRLRAWSRAAEILIALAFFALLAYWWASREAGHALILSVLLLLTHLAIGLAASLAGLFIPMGWPVWAIILAAAVGFPLNAIRSSEKEDEGDEIIPEGRASEPPAAAEAISTDDEALDAPQRPTAPPPSASLDVPPSVTTAAPLEQPSDPKG